MQPHSKSVKEKIAQHIKNLEFEKAHNVHRYLQNLRNYFYHVKTSYSLTKYEKDIALATAPMRRIKEEDFEIGKKVQELICLEKAPTTIDCFDISHFQSRYIVGSCIRFTNGIPDKNSFSRFKIKTLKEQNDYAALQEIVTATLQKPRRNS